MFVGVFFKDGSMFSVAIDSINGRDEFSDKAVFSELLVVDPVVMVSRWVRVVRRRGHTDDLKISEGSVFSPEKKSEEKVQKYHEK